MQDWPKQKIYSRKINLPSSAQNSWVNKHKKLGRGRGEGGRWAKVKELGERENPKSLFYTALAYGSAIDRKGGSW